MRAAPLAIAVLVAALPACKRREGARADAPAPTSFDTGRVPVTPAKVALPLPACDKNPALARGLEKLFKTKPNKWEAKPGRFPDAGCAVVAAAGDDCTQSPDETGEPDEAKEAAAAPRRLIGVLDPVTGALRAGQVEEMSGLGEACFSSEWIDGVLDLDGDGIDELVTKASSSHHAENIDSATVYRVEKKSVSQIGWIPISFETVGQTDDEESGASCAGMLSVLPAGADGGPALELTAKVEGKNELTKEQCLPGRRRFHVAAGRLVAKKLAGKAVKPPTR